MRLLFKGVLPRHSLITGSCIDWMLLPFLYFNLRSTGVSGYSSVVSPKPGNEITSGGFCKPRQPTSFPPGMQQVCGDSF